MIHAVSGMRTLPPSFILKKAHQRHNPRFVLISFILEANPSKSLPYTNKYLLITCTCNSLPSFHFLCVFPVSSTNPNVIVNFCVLGLHAAAAAAKSLQSCPTLWGPHRWQPTRLLHPWDFPDKNTGVGCQRLLHWVYIVSPNSTSKSQWPFTSVWVRNIYSEVMGKWNLPKISVQDSCNEIKACMYR